MSLKLEKRDKHLPYNWRHVSLAEVCDFGGGKTPRKSNDSYWDGTIPWISPKDFDSVQMTDTEDKLTEKALSDTSIRLYPSGSIVMVVRSGVLKHSLPVAQLEIEAAVNQDIKVLQPKSDRITKKYLLNILIYESDRIRTSCAKTGTTVESIETAFLSKYKIPLPPLSEQHCIADILSTVDKEIQQTEKIIENTEELRYGLMQNFFHTGYYTHSTTEEPTFGEIPDDWNLQKLSEVADVVMGSSPKSKYYNEKENGLPFFQANNEFGYRTPTHDRWCSEPQKIAEEGDTLITIRGTYVGQVNVAAERCCIGRGLGAVSATEVDQEYLYHQLADRERYVKSIASGSTFDSINSTELESLLVLVPPKNEQEKIASCLQTLQQRYLHEREYKQKLQQLKRGLMQDLLTGKVRVTPDSDET